MGYILPLAPSPVAIKGVGKLNAHNAESLTAAASGARRRQGPASGGKKIAGFDEDELEEKEENSTAISHALAAPVQQRMRFSKASNITAIKKKIRAGPGMCPGQLLQASTGV